MQENLQHARRFAAHASSFGILDDRVGIMRVMQRAANLTLAPRL